MFAIASGVLLFIDKNDFKLDSALKGVAVIAVILLFSILYATVRTMVYKCVEKIKGKLYVKYDDLWNIAFSRNGQKKIVVVNVNTTFDTIVDTDLSSIDKPLVSARTIHGQWVNKMVKKGISVADLDKAITDNLELQSIQPYKVIEQAEKTRGKCKCYSRGTIAVYEYGNTIFYLLALSEFDENNNAQNTKEELISTIIKLIEYYDKHGNGYDLYIPLLGTGQSRTGIEREDSLEILTSMFRLYADRIHGRVNIIVYYKDRDKISLGI